ncbi:pullulanase-type alpha-1,6-glucosidase [Rhodohalobacter halophilus]|uniref:pullulanase-type alpha-1,6-glucosidase n=1 Tax=Rhodohalobacter halophilus TaxID=1812810 RepID=UPI00083FBFDC|nr:pullulanase-type alpha-1,6-glucosidase [Rhodohalobacter halophilus]
MRFNYISLFIIITGLFLSSCTTPEPAVEITTEVKIDGASAHWVSSDLLIWDPVIKDAARYEILFSEDADITLRTFDIPSGESISIRPDGMLTAYLADKFRHISDRPVFSVDADHQTVRDALKGQIIAVAFDSNGIPVSATRVQTHGVLDDLYTYDEQLGPIYSGDDLSLKLWAPTAQNVTLSIFDKEKNIITEIDPTQAQPENGVWEFENLIEWDRYFYRFNVTVFHPENNQINTFEVTDPYSVSLSTDSRYSQFVNLTDDDIKPNGWDELKKELPFPTDITLYEAHMRDFSIADQSVPQDHRGTYMAFTHNGENGRNLSDAMAHLKRLSDSGLTHLHLLPINDIASIKEDKSDRVDLNDPFTRICEVIGTNEQLTRDCEKYGNTPIREVFEDLAADDPTTLEIQRIYRSPEHSNKLADYDAFNWGYDPFHFNVPEGSYSTNPEGVQRILETRNMVQALDEIDLNIVVDVVYNHTHATGSSRFSVLDKVVPDYYHRLNPDSGDVEMSTCCPNTAAEFNMMENLIIDSVLLWAKEYKIDSFRFDLMGHHPRYVMERLTEELAKLTLEEDGVDGENIYIYGEGWNFGEVADNRIFDQATQFMMGGTGIGNFNDRSRDGIRGGNYTNNRREQGFTNGRYLFPNEDAGDADKELAVLLDHADRIRVGMTGNLAKYPYINRNGENVTGGNEMIGYAELPQESVNYIDKHDNETLWDNTQSKLPHDLEMSQRIRVHLLSQAMINFGQGVPFHQMGTDILRSKSMDRNSYDSGDWYNAIDFTLETNNWGIGLPPGWDNSDLWDGQREFLSNPNIEIQKEHMELAHQLFREQLEVRYSSPLFRLQSGEEINTRVAFHNTGPDQKPGIIAMSYSDGVCTGNDLDPNLDGILIIFNSSLDEQSIELNLSGISLHPVLESGSDEVVKESRVENGSFTVPGLTAAVFVKEQNGGQGEFVCNPAE